MNSGRLNIDDDLEGLGLGLTEDGKGEHASNEVSEGLMVLWFLGITTPFIQCR